MKVPCLKPSSSICRFVLSTVIVRTVLGERFHMQFRTLLTPGSHVRCHQRSWREDVHKRVPSAVGQLVGTQLIPVQAVCKLGVMLDRFDRLIALLEIPDARRKVVRHRSE